MKDRTMPNLMSFPSLKSYDRISSKNSRCRKNSRDKRRIDIDTNSCLYLLLKSTDFNLGRPINRPNAFVGGVPPIGDARKHAFAI